MYIERYWEIDSSLWRTSKKDSLEMAYLVKFRCISKGNYSGKVFTETK